MLKVHFAPNSRAGRIIWLMEELELEYEVNVMPFSKEGLKSDEHRARHALGRVPVLEDGPYWKKGDLFLSLRNLSMVLLYRPSTNKIIWNKIGLAVSQHDIDILNDYTISIFSNNTPNVKPKHGYSGVYSDVLVYNFKTDSVSSPYKKAFEKK